MLKRIVVFGIIIFVFFINILRAQTSNDTLYFDVADQWFVKYYYITDTVTGDEYIINKVKYAPQILQQLQFDSINCVLMIEAKMKFGKKTIFTYLKPSTIEGKYLRIFVFRKKITYYFSDRRYYVI